MKYEDIPQNFVNCMVSIEDKKMCIRDRQIAMVVQSGDYATAGFWCIVIIAISFAYLV